MHFKFARTRRHGSLTLVVQFNFDTSEVVISQCRERNTSRPQMEVRGLDATVDLFRLSCL